MGPRLRLRGVTEEVHDDGTPRDGLVDIEEVLAGDPAVLDGVLPGLAILTDTDNDIQAVVAEVEALAVALGSVADEGESVVLEIVLLCVRRYHPSAFGMPRRIMDVTHKKLLLGPVGTLCNSIVSQRDGRRRPNSPQDIP